MYTPGSGSPQTIPYVTDKASCPSTGDGWYYDNAANPTQIILCSSTCGTVEADSRGVRSTSRSAARRSSNSSVASDRCDCDTGEPFAACCGLALASRGLPAASSGAEGRRGSIDGVPAPTALALMRSRYTAFVRKDFDYLVATHDPETRGATNAGELARATSRTLWLGLEIITTSAGGETDDTGVVAFIARGSANGKSFAQRERSRFRRVAGLWVYSDGDIT